MITQIKKLSIVIFIGVIFLFLIQYLINTDFRALGAYLLSSPIILPVLILISLLGHIAGTIAWKLCMTNERDRIGFTELFFVRLVSENLTMFNPTNVIAGDGLKAIFLNRKEVEYQTAAKSVVLSRVLLIVAAVLLMMLSTMYLIVKGTEGLSWLWIIGTIGIGLSITWILLILFFGKKLFLFRVAKFLGQSMFAKWVTEARVEKIKLLNMDLVAYNLSNRKRLFLALDFSVLQWLCGALEFLVILHFFGLSVGPIDAVAIEMGVLGFKTAGSIVPGQIGVEEYGNKVMLALVGVSGVEIWIVVSLLRRARQLFWLATAGLASAALYKKYRVKPV